MHGRIDDIRDRRKKKEEMMFALRFDGFVQDHIIYKTLAEAAEAYNKAVKNSLLYEYDCCVVELDENKNTKRRVSFEELKG